MKKPNLKTILVPIDFSELSRDAIVTAKGLARRFGAEIHLVHVHEFPFTPRIMGPIPATVMAYRDDAAIRRMRRLQGLAKRNDLPVANCHFMVGAPTFREICQRAREISADLIVMSTHGSSGLARFFRGSTVERIVQHAPCPVLVVRGSERMSRPSPGEEKTTMETILVPVDFSQSSFQALEFAIEFARKVTARLLIYHAVPVSDAFTVDGYALYDLSVLEEAARKDARQQMGKFISLAKFGGVAFETLVETTAPITGICALAEERAVDLIITATHGRTGLKHVLMGSVAEVVVRHSRRPVLVIPSHPEIRVSRLTKKGHRAPPPAVPPVKKERSSPTSASRAKGKRKLVAPGAPGRRRTRRLGGSPAARS
ncbi:MAG: universal stress protein [Chthoniobacterales bacterium]